MFQYFTRRSVEIYFTGIELYILYIYYIRNKNKILCQFAPLFSLQCFHFSFPSFNFVILLFFVSDSVPPRPRAPLQRVKRGSRAPMPPLALGLYFIFFRLPDSLCMDHITRNQHIFISTGNQSINQYFYFLIKSRNYDTFCIYNHKTIVTHFSLFLSFS